MTKKLVVVLLAALFLFTSACTFAICDVCGAIHDPASGGGSSPKPFLSITSYQSGDYFRINIRSCWSGSIQFISSFVACGDITALYDEISGAEANVPFEAVLIGEIITITTDIPGLEEIYIKYSQNQRNVGVEYNIGAIRDNYDTNDKTDEIGVIPDDDNKLGVPLLEFINKPSLIEFAENFDNNFPVSVSVRHDGEASGEPVTATDPDVIRSVFDALCNITVLEEWHESGATDDYLNYYFEMPNGDMIWDFVFQKGMYLDGWMGLYVITGFENLQEALKDPCADNMYCP